MNLPPRVRSDYHHLCEDDDFYTFVRRWVKPSLWLVLGFFGGVVCHRAFFDQQQNNLAFSQNNASYSVQMRSQLIGAQFKD